MHRPDIQWAYQAIIDLDLSFDALGYPIHLENFLRLFLRYPRMRTVIDHCMKPVIRADEFEPWARRIAKIADETGVFCKLSGIVTEAGPNWALETIEPYARHVISAFGPDRVMWGSDWPVLEIAGTYDRWRETAECIVGGDDADKIFGGTAAAFYRLK
jgi:L-fuconolactonase